MYSNEAERANLVFDMYDDFKLKKTHLGSMVYMELFQRCIRVKQV